MSVGPCPRHSGCTIHLLSVTKVAIAELCVSTLSNVKTATCERPTREFPGSVLRNPESQEQCRVPSGCRRGTSPPKRNPEGPPTAQQTRPEATAQTDQGGCLQDGEAAGVPRGDREAETEAERRPGLAPACRPWGRLPAARGRDERETSQQS